MQETQGNRRSVAQVTSYPSPLCSPSLYRSLLFLSRSSVTELIRFIRLLTGLSSVSGWQHQPLSPEILASLVHLCLPRTRTMPDHCWCAAYVFRVNIRCVKGYLKCAHVLWTNEVTSRIYPTGKPEHMPNTIQTSFFSVAFREPGKRTETTHCPWEESSLNQPWCLHTVNNPATIKRK